MNALYTTDRFCIYIPLALHAPLRASQDDIFFKLCRMKGIAFDVQHKLGTLFFLVDKVVGGALSLICIGASRLKSMDITLQAITFVLEQFGKDQSSEVLYRKCDHLADIGMNLKKLQKQEKHSASK